MIKKRSSWDRKKPEVQRPYNLKVLDCSRNVKTVGGKKEELSL